MSELQERTFHSENDKRRFTLSFSPDRLFFTISWRNNRGINASHFNILRDEAISVAEDILDRYKPAESAPAARDEGWSMASIHRELSEAAERSRPVTLSAAEARTVLDTLAAERERAVNDFRMDALDAVMYSVRKWLPDDYVEASPETAAADAREIALKAIEAVEAKVVRTIEANDQLASRVIAAEAAHLESQAAGARISIEVKALREAVHKIANHSIGQLAARIDAENMRDLARSAMEKAALLAHEAPKEGA